MTFKHVQFEDSVTMRSLLKVAQDKGWVKPEPITKSAASIQLDITPTNDLMENILKLCGGLRHAGLESYANELELKLINYKRANSLYETSKETGDDLIESAHPQGSAKLEGVEGDAVVETILDTHLKMLEMVNKKVNTKSAKDIINAVKIIVAQDTSGLDESLRNTLSRIKQILQKISSMIESTKDLTFSTSSLGSYQAGFNQLANNPTIDNLNKMKNLLGKLTFRLKPGMVMGVSEDTWSVVGPLLDSAMPLVDKAIGIRQKINQSKSNELMRSEESSQLAVQIAKMMRTLSNFKPWINGDANIPDQDKKTAIGWIDGKIHALNSMKSDFDGSSVERQNELAPRLLQELGKLTADVKAFENEWIS
jgi:hypothetical protein